MGVRENGVFEEFSVVSGGARSAPAEVTLPFPPKDYNKKGRLKKVRGRMLKKLLKREIAYYLPVTLFFGAILLISSILFAIALRGVIGGNPQEPKETREVLFAVFSGMVFMISCSGAMIFSTIAPINRYNKNFFQNEGYLTFSVPASVEEHVPAKRIGAICCTLACSLLIAVAVCILLLLSIGFPDFSGGVDLPSQVGLLVVELALSLLVGIVMTHGLYGVGSCLLSKKSGKKKTGLVLLVTFAVMTVLEMLLPTVFGTGANAVPTTLLGTHIFLWVSILLQAALAVGCICFEVWYLKHKLDLK